MKLLTTFSQVSLALTVAALAAGCGGGDDADAGGLTPFNIVPSAVTLTGPDTLTCGSGFASRVFVYGGSGPYSIANSQPGAVVLSTSRVDRPGGYFDVFVSPGACLDTVSLIVRDQLGRQTTFSVSAVVGGT